MTICLVSAYGRVATPPYVLRSKKILQSGYSLYINDDVENAIFGEDNIENATFKFSYVTEIITDVITKKFVVPKSAAVNLTLGIEELKLYKKTGELIPNELDIFEIQDLFGGYFASADFNFTESHITSRNYTINNTDFIPLSASAFGKEPVSLFFKLTSCEQTDFGAFEEYVVTFEPTGKAYTEQINLSSPRAIEVYPIENPVLLAPRRAFEKI